MDRRTKSRIDVQLTCFIGNGKAHAEPIRALTENVSRDGMLMRWMEGAPLPNVDKKLVLDIKLPENSGVGPRVMRCRTEVVRITPEGDTHAVALRVLSMRFIKFRQATVVNPGNDLALMPVTAERVN